MSYQDEFRQDLFIYVITIIVLLFVLIVMFSN